MSVDNKYPMGGRPMNDAAKEIALQKYKREKEERERKIFNELYERVMKQNARQGQ